MKLSYARHLVRVLILSASFLVSTHAKAKEPVSYPVAAYVVGEISSLGVTSVKKDRGEIVVKTAQYPILKIMVTAQDINYIYAAGFGARSPTVRIVIRCSQTGYNYGYYTLIGECRVDSIVLEGAPTTPYPPSEPAPQPPSNPAPSYSDVIYGINSEGSVFGFSGGGWNYMSPKLTQLSVGRDGSVAGIDQHGDLYKYDGKEWSVTRGYVLRQVKAVGVDNIWGIAATGFIFRKESFYEHWYNPGFKPASLAVGSDGAAFALDTEGRIYQNVGGSNWRQVPGWLTQIEVGSADNVWGLNGNGEIFKYNGNDTWTHVPGWLTQISVGTDGTMFGINGYQEIFRYNGQGGWIKYPGLLKQIKVGNANNVWGVNSNDNIYRLNNQRNDWDQIGGLLGQIDVK